MSQSTERGHAEMPVSPDADLQKDVEKFLEDLIKNRRSHYPMQYTGAGIPDKKIRKLLEYANYAPNHKKTQPWRFHVFKGTALLALIECNRQFYLDSTSPDKVKQNKLHKFELRKEKVSHVIAIVVHKDPEGRVPEIEEIAAVACSVQNMYLSLRPMGLGGYWSTGKFAFSEAAREHLKLRQNEILMGFFYLGVVDNPLPSYPHSGMEERIKWHE